MPRAWHKRTGVVVAEIQLPGPITGFPVASPRQDGSTSLWRCALPMPWKSWLSHFRPRPDPAAEDGDRSRGWPSAYVAGLSIYAQGQTRARTARAIVRTLRAYLEAHPEEQPHVPEHVRFGLRIGSSSGGEIGPVANRLTAPGLVPALRAGRIVPVAAMRQG